MNSDNPNLKEHIIENRFLLYMDLLGIKEITRNEPEKILSLVKRFSVNVKPYSEGFKEYEDGKYDLHKLEPEFSHFSDHVVVSYPTNFYSIPQRDHSQIFLLSLISIAVQLHRMALETEFIMRGAITYGSLYHLGATIVGQALVEAEQLERTTAIYPRVILSDSVAQFLSSKVKPICQDEDGLYFINYLIAPEFNLITWHVPEKDDDEFFNGIQKIHQTIITGIEQTKNDIHNRSKWHWLENKFRDAVTEHIKNFPNTLDKMKSYGFLNSLKETMLVS